MSCRSPVPTFTGERTRCDVCGLQKVRLALSRCQRRCRPEHHSSLAQRRTRRSSFPRTTHTAANSTTRRRGVTTVAASVHRWCWFTAVNQDAASRSTLETCRGAGGAPPWLPATGCPADVGDALSGTGRLATHWPRPPPGRAHPCIVAQIRRLGPARASTRSRCARWVDPVPLAHCPD